MHRIDKKRVVLVIDHEPSSHKAIARIGQRVDCSVLSFSDAAEFSSWLQANTHHAARRDMLVCVVFDSQFGGIFQQRMPACNGRRRAPAKERDATGHRGEGRQRDPGR